MKFFPYETISYKTNLNQEKIFHLLKNFVRTANEDGFTGNDYQGVVNENSFEIMLIGYRKKWKQSISGEIEKSFDGTNIRVKMKLPKVALLYLLGYAVGLSYMTFTLYRAFFLNHPGNPLWRVVFVPAGGFFLLYLVMIISFNVHCHKTKRDLKELFQAEIIPG